MGLRATGARPGCLLWHGHRPLPGLCPLPSHYVPVWPWGQQSFPHLLEQCLGGVQWWLLTTFLAHSWVWKQRGFPVAVNTVRSSFMDQVQSWEPRPRSRNVARVQREEMIKGLENSAYEASFKELDFFLEKKRREDDSTVIFKRMRGNYEGSGILAAFPPKPTRGSLSTRQQEGSCSLLLKTGLRLREALLGHRPPWGCQTRHLCLQPKK